MAGLLPSNIKLVSRNRKAGADYFLEDRYQAGVILTGTEIKSIRGNRINLQDGFVEERGGELWLLGVHISPYQQAGIYGLIDPLRPRKLLMHKREIAEIISRMHERGYTVVPTTIYLEKGRAKIEIALAKGKRQTDKRQAIAKRDSDRDIAQALKERSHE